MGSTMLNENIRAMRKIRHLSQVELADALHVSKQCVSNWENDNILPSVEMLVRIAQYFGVSTDALLGLERENTISVDGLSELEIDHVKMIVNDLKKKRILTGETPKLRYLKAERQAEKQKFQPREQKNFDFPSPNFNFLSQNLNSTDGKIPDNRHLSKNSNGKFSISLYIIIKKKPRL